MSAPARRHPTRDEFSQMTTREVNQFLASLGISVRVRDDGAPDLPTPTCDVCWYQGAGRHRCETGWVVMALDGQRTPEVRGQQ